jgi:hypothetical protein
LKTGGAVEIFGRPVLTSEAVAASSAQSGPATVVSMTTGGIIINLLFDAAAMAAPASFRAGIQQAASISTGAIADHITVNIKIDYSGKWRRRFCRARERPVPKLFVRPGQPDQPRDAQAMRLSMRCPVGPRSRGNPMSLSGMHN